MQRSPTTFRRSTSCRAAPPHSAVTRRRRGRRRERTRSGDGVDGLRRDRAEAKAQLAATSEVLTALGRSASDRDAILGTVVGWAQRLCRADMAKIHLVDSEVLTREAVNALPQSMRWQRCAISGRPFKAGAPRPTLACSTHGQARTAST